MQNFVVTGKLGNDKFVVHGHCNICNVDLIDIITKKELRKEKQFFCEECK